MIVLRTRVGSAGLLLLYQLSYRLLPIRNTSDTWNLLGSSSGKQQVEYMHETKLTRLPGANQAFASFDGKGPNQSKGNDLV
jgi:hypothetical protein